jgi:hypothetical protein
MLIFDETLLKDRVGP